jgi:hypothetical protein
MRDRELRVFDGRCWPICPHHWYINTSFFSAQIDPRWGAKKSKVISEQGMAFFVTKTGFRFGLIYPVYKIISD